MHLSSIRNIITIFASAALLLFANPPMDAAISINNVSGSWTSVNSGQNVTGIGTNQINWGWPSGTYQNSAYRFLGDAPPIFNVNPDTVFNLGSFTHFNYPIPLGSGIKGASLSVTLNLTIGSTTLNNLHFTYDFVHNETPNIQPCQAGSASICDDIVSIVNNEPLSDIFTIDGIAYTIKILGFQVGSNQFSQFYTLENKTNTAYLRAVITSVPVPEPEMYLLLGSFLIVTAWTLRYRRKQATKA